MADLVPYLSFPGTAREALEFYAGVFGGVVQVNTYAEFSRTDGPPESIAHGMLSGGAVSLFACDAGADEVPVRIEGAMFSLLGSAERSVLHLWFDRLAEGGEIRDPLAPKPWGASDGQVVDRYGIAWLIGYEPAEGDAVR